jgi:hypothetical protein
MARKEKAAEGAASTTTTNITTTSTDSTITTTSSNVAANSNSSETSKEITATTSVVPEVPAPPVSPEVGMSQVEHTQKQKMKMNAWNKAQRKLFDEDGLQHSVIS